jgi:hypothetical protein
MVVATPSATPESAPPSPVMPATTAPPPKRISGALKAVVVVVVAVLVLAVLALGIIPGIHPFASSSGSANGVSSASAGATAAPVAASHGSGQLLLMLGLGLTFSYTLPANYVNESTGCPVTGGSSSSVTIPAQSGGYANGDAAAWFLLYNNTSAVSSSFVLVVGSTPYFLGTIAGPDCSVSSENLSFLPSTFVSSTTAASAAGSALSGFTSSHSSANAIYLLENNTSIGFAWYIIYTNCSYNPTTEQLTGGAEGEAGYGLVNASTGALIGAILDISSPNFIDCSESSLGVPFVPLVLVHASATCAIALPLALSRTLEG